jgi:hypothetical protein
MTVKIVSAKKRYRRLSLELAHRLLGLLTVQDKRGPISRGQSLLVQLEFRGPQRFGGIVTVGVSGVKILHQQ